MKKIKKSISEFVKLSNCQILKFYFFMDSLSESLSESLFESLSESERVILSPFLWIHEYHESFFIFDEVAKSQNAKQSKPQFLTLNFCGISRHFVI